MTTSPVTTRITAADWRSRGQDPRTAPSQICLACHVRPDADALGSMLAVATALASGRPRRCRRSSPRSATSRSRCPAILRFLPGVELLTPPAELPGAARGDGDLRRRQHRPARALLARRRRRAGELIVLDHHASNTGFGTVNLVDPAAAATAVRRGRADRPAGHPADQRHRARPVRGPGHRHRLVQVLGHHAAGARAGRPAAGDRHRPRHRSARELYDRAPFGYLGMLSAALGPGRAGARGRRRPRPGLDHRDPSRPRRRRGLPLDAAESVIDVVRADRRGRGGRGAQGG